MEAVCLIRSCRAFLLSEIHPSPRYPRNSPRPPLPEGIRVPMWGTLIPRKKKGSEGARREPKLSAMPFRAISTGLPMGPTQTGPNSAACRKNTLIRPNEERACSRKRHQPAGCAPCRNPLTGRAYSTAHHQKFRNGNYCRKLSKLRRFWLALTCSEESVLGDVRRSEWG